MATKTMNIRKKHLDAISAKIAMFIVTECFAGDETDLQMKLSQAVEILDQVAAACVANDEKDVAQAIAA
jgi:hypothetical protein